MLPVDDRVGLPPAQLDELTRAVAPLVSLGDALLWAGVDALQDVFVQDEYTHDVVLRHGPHYLVFDST